LGKEIKSKISVVEREDNSTEVETRVTFLEYVVRRRRK
jgi:hypothetical protein